MDESRTGTDTENQRTREYFRIVRTRHFDKAGDATSNRIALQLKTARQPEKHERKAHRKPEKAERKTDMRIDYWSDGRKEKVARIDCFFYPNDGIYRGNLYDENGKMIGDYSTRDSTEIERRFSKIFNFGN